MIFQEDLTSTPVIIPLCPCSLDSILTPSHTKNKFIHTVIKLVDNVAVNKKNIILELNSETLCVVIPTHLFFQKFIFKPKL